MLYTTFTDQGCRQYNEDSYGTETYGDSTCFVLADGLGGHGGGDIASQTAVSAVCKLFKQEGYSDSFFEKAFDSAQEAIVAEQEKANNYDGIKSTLVILVVSGKYAYYAHVGDSRLYVIKNGRIKTHTLDHSVPQMLVLSKEIKESEIRHHPDRSKLLRVLGVKDSPPKCDIAKPVKLSGNQSFLLCSDGFWELIEDKDIEETNKIAEDTEEWMDSMSGMVCKNGEGTDMDNYSAIAIWIDDGDISTFRSDSEEDSGLFRVEFETPGLWEPKNRNRKAEKGKRAEDKNVDNVTPQNNGTVLIEAQQSNISAESTDSDASKE